MHASTRAAGRGVGGVAGANQTESRKVTCWLLHAAVPRGGGRVEPPAPLWSRDIRRETGAFMTNSAV
jgi:hypothetical protein